MYFNSLEIGSAFYSTVLINLWCMNLALINMFPFFRVELIFTIPKLRKIQIIFLSIFTKRVKKNIYIYL